MSKKADVTGSQLQADLENVKQEIEKLEQAGDLDSKAELMVYGVVFCLERVYTGMEAILERVAREIDESVPTGAAYHVELLKQAARPTRLRNPVISKDVFASLNDLRGFRHLVRHAYGQEVDRQKVSKNMTLALGVFPTFAEQIENFAQWLQSSEEPSRDEMS